MNDNQPYFLLTALLATARAIAVIYFFYHMALLGAAFSKSEAAFVLKDGRFYVESIK